MSLESGHNKYIKREKLENGNYKNVSMWTSSDTVEMENGQKLQSEYDILKERVDSLSSLPSGSTSGNAELLDIRVPANNSFNGGQAYPTAGEAIRDQINKVNTIAVQPEQPTAPNAQLWIDSDSEDEFTVPEIKDNVVSEEDTWSSKKIVDSIKEVDDKVTQTNDTLSNLTENIGCSLPISEYFMTVGIAEDWFSDSFVTPKGFVVNMYSGSEADRYNDRYAFANNSQYYGNNAYSWNLYDSLLNLVKKEANTGYGYARNCKTLNLQNCTLLAIGDSTVDHDVMTSKIKSFFAENGKVCTLLGTLGDGKGDGNNNEGRAGWTTSDYFTNKTYNGVVNPFYNPSSQTFDFSYYLSNQGYTSVDFVAIQLGINDLYNFDDTKIVPTWENIKRMIDSIRSYDASVKVILNLPTTPNADQSKHSVFEPLYRNRVIRYCEYATRKAKELYSTNNVRVSYNHLILNPNTDIRDNVHPTNSGYEKMGLEVCNQINCWQN